MPHDLYTGQQRNEGHETAPKPPAPSVARRLLHLLAWMQEDIGFRV